MEKEIAEILDAMFGQMFKPTWIENATNQILALSPWKKFEGKVEDFPIVVGWDISNVTIYIEDEEDVSDYFPDQDYENAYYMPVPPLPNHDI